MVGHFQTPGNKLNNVNCNMFPKSIAGRTRCPHGPHVPRGPRVWDAWTKCWSRKGYLNSFVDLHWSISLAYTSKSWLSWKFLVQRSEWEGGDFPHPPSLVTRLARTPPKQRSLFYISSRCRLHYGEKDVCFVREKFIKWI